jgi:hypothetical protein
MGKQRKTELRCKKHTPLEKTVLKIEEFAATTSAQRDKACSWDADRM